MPVEYFLKYKGQCYDVGTRLKFKHCGYEKEGQIEWFINNHVGIRLTDGSIWSISMIWGLDNTITEIIEPVYYMEPQSKKVYGGPLPSDDDLFVGWVWYIVIMLVGTIFRDRLTIWVFATAIFFLWKNGFFNGGSK